MIESELFSNFCNWGSSPEFSNLRLRIVEKESKKYKLRKYEEEWSLKVGVFLELPN